MKIYTHSATSQTLQIGKAWKDQNSINHSPDWHVWDSDTLSSHGITVSDVTPPDSRFYEADGSAKDLSVLKTKAVAKIKREAFRLLAQTDWYVIRKTERDVAIPSEISTYRAAVVSASNTITTKITGAANLDAFKALHAGSPAPINNWPEE